MEAVTNTYPDFEFSASELSAFSAANDFFTLSLTNGSIIHFSPNNKDHFLTWLIAHKIRDIHSDLNDEVPPDIENNSRSWKRFFNFKRNME